MEKRLSYAKLAPLVRALLAPVRGRPALAELVPDARGADVTVLMRHLAPPLRPGALRGIAV